MVVISPFRSRRKLCETLFASMSIPNYTPSGSTSAGGESTLASASAGAGSVEVGDAGLCGAYGNAQR